MATVKANVEVVPASGKSTSKDVEFTGTGIAMKDFLKMAGLDANNMNLSVNGEPADLRTHISANDKVTLTEKAKGS